jgi:hypothetical protein
MGEVCRAQGRKNPTPGIQIIEGFNEVWIEFEGGFEGYVKGQTSLELSSKKCFEIFANRPHRANHLEGVLLISSIGL